MPAPVPAPAPAMPNASASMLLPLAAPACALRLTECAAVTVDGSMKALTVLVTVLSATAAPIERAPPAPSELAPIAIAVPPASERIEEPSFAVICTEPAVDATVLPTIDASIVLVIVLYDPAPAPARATEVRVPPAKLNAPPIVSASILDVDSASS